MSNGLSQQTPLSEISLEILKDGGREAARLEAEEVGTEHILLSLACEQDNLAGRALAEMNVS
jgi:hypothetical protein